MTAHSGSRIVQDGLIFSYDMGSKQSWKGINTTNELQNPSFSDGITGWSVTIRDPAEFNDYYEIREEDGIPYLHVHWERHTGTGNSWGFVRNDDRITTATYYTWSGQFRVRAASTAAAGAIRAAAFVNDTGQAYSTGWLDTDILDSDIGNGWIDFSMSRTLLSTYNSGAISLNALFEIVSFTMANAGDVVEFDIRLPQIEQHSFASPFVEGTRLNTESIIDTAGSNTITASSLTYASDNTFSFNGTNNYISCANSSDFDTGAITVSYWFYTSWPGSGWSPFIGKFNGATHQFRTWIGSDRIIDVKVVNQANFNVSSVLGLNEWCNIVVTLDDSQTQCYLNGKFFGNSTSEVLGAHTTTDLIIGKDHTTNYGSGNLPVVNIYNRVLTADEVKQNFNALRSRFNI